MTTEDHEPVRMQELRFECDYWLAALEDIRSLNETLARCAATAVETSNACMPLAITSTDESLEVIVAVVPKMTRMLHELMDAQKALVRLTELAAGRAVVLEQLIAQEGDA